MSFVLHDTIAAIATASAPAWRGIVRLSGPAVVDCVRGTFTPDGKVNWIASRHPTIVPGTLHLDLWHSPAPCDLYYWPGRRSYTRQPVIELHTLGAPPLLEAVLAAICRGGARLARPGEFTLRAFLAGRLDLTQAEAVLGVIDAADRRQLDIALAQLAGGLSQPLARLRDELLDALAHLEAGLDFADEDIEFISRDELAARLAGARQTVDAILTQITTRGGPPATFRAVLVGWPNVGKSSLFNALAGGHTAIVSTIPGTTRDYLTATLELDGVTIELLDTAGVEPQSAGDSLATQAQTMTARGRHQSDLELFCLDSTRPLNEWETAELSTANPSRIVLLTKSDLPPFRKPEASARAPEGSPHKPEAQARDPGGTANVPPPHVPLPTSAATGLGLADLRAAIRRRVEAAQSTESPIVAATAVRCRQSLAGATAALARAQNLLADQPSDELIAAEIRLALDELAQIVGAVYTDDLLDRIFSRFCIGK